MNYARSIVFDTDKSASYSIAVGDLNGNNIPDLVIANVNSFNTVFLSINKGNKWQKIVLGKEKLNTYDIVLADINNDGKPDILESNSDEINKYYINLGPPVKTDN